MDIHWTHNICHGYNRTIIIYVIISRAFSQQTVPCWSQTMNKKVEICEDWNVWEMVNGHHSMLYSMLSTFLAYSRAIKSFSAQVSTTPFCDDIVDLWWCPMHLGYLGQTTTMMETLTGVHRLDLPYISCGKIQRVMEGGPFWSPLACRVEENQNVWYKEIVDLFHWRIEKHPDVPSPTLMDRPPGSYNYSVHCSIKWHKWQKLVYPMPHHIDMAKLSVHVVCSSFVLA